MTSFLAPPGAETAQAPRGERTRAAWRQRRGARWGVFFFRRLARLVVVLLVLVVVTFGMVRLVPGDPARKVVGLSADEGAYERTRERMHLDEPLPEQLGAYVADLVHLDLGQSFRTDEPVTTVIADRVGPTAQITLFAVVLVLVVSIPLGMVVGGLTYAPRPWLENGFTAVTGTLSGIPHYLTATFLTFVFAVALDWLPVAGNGPLKYAVLPAVAMSVRPIALLSRVVRVETVNVLGEDYMRTARAKRLPRRTLHGRHVLPNVMTPTLTITGALVASLISGAVIVEQVFARTGLGSALVTSVLIGDYPVVQGITLLLGAVVVVVNTGVDLAVALVDPRSVAVQP